MKHPRPLEGVVIVELGHSVAGPYAGLILADLGARVIKVENPKHGDYARDWGPPFWGDTSSSFASLNRGKESITVDFADPEEAAALRRLILDKADGVIQNLRPGILDAYGLSAAEFRKEKPSLIWCDIGAFGANGPMARKPGYDPLVQASSGIMSVTGEGNRPPVRVGISLVDMGSGMWAALGFLASFIARMKQGEGAQVSTSLFETGLAWMMIPLAGYEAAGDVRKPYGSGVAEIVPYQAFETMDGWLMIAAGNDNLFRKFCDVLDRKDLTIDPDFVTNSARVVNRERLIPIVAAAVARFEADELGRRLDAVGVPNAPLLGVEEVAHHPQTKALDLNSPCDDNLSLVSIPISFDGVRPRTSRRAPKLGEHNANFKSGT
ncbi:CaiB/BaiF CoA transferase family protein [Bradyrhizobium canariense]|uniref:Crotonobetainyl-CoA:carnitine CoA-transferase CaiB n=1 Tax=Bradyrhizobium canariense TaxID=255045 RepID=A0A1H1T7W7_9BRAD|nr:CoA transferase [Bradyrhizobium canariense]SDS56261.1 Crotonobetainyl-CoA:carnitine CoA-transferase CaiB [Bradyrhizobium canariense]